MEEAAGRAAARTWTRDRACHTYYHIYECMSGRINILRCTCTKIDRIVCFFTLGIWICVVTYVLINCVYEYAHSNVYDL